MSLSKELICQQFKAAMSCEESEQLLHTIYRRYSSRYSSNDKKEAFFDQLLFLQFHAAPYYQLVREASITARIAKQNNSLSLEAFKQATQWGKCSPGRIHLLILAYCEVLGYGDEMHLGTPKDVRLLHRLLQDPQELAAIRVIASNVLLHMPLSLVSDEEKNEIARSALCLEPTQEEDEGRCRVFYTDPDGKIAMSIGEILLFWKKPIRWNLDRHAIEGPRVLVSKRTPQCKECVHPDVDADLFRRTSEVGGNKCDYCHATVEELGVTKLKLCGKCQNAYYCGASCQHKAWREGHKEACRAEQDIRPGDLMHLLGLEKKTELNGRLVKVVKQDVDSGRWAVHLLSQYAPGDDITKLFAVKVSSLKHIRPAA